MITNGFHTPSATAGHWSAQVAGPLVQDPASAVVFHHQGDLDHALVRSLLQLAEKASVCAGDAITLRKRLFNVLVEAHENMHKHAPKEHRDSVFAILVDRGDGYRMIIGNAVPLASAALLVHRVGILNEMEEVDLKEHFLRLLSNDGRTERAGAGLGLTIATAASRSRRGSRWPRS